MVTGVRGGKCSTTEVGFTGELVKSSCLILNFGRKADVSLTASGVPSEIAAFGGKCPLSHCSIKTFKIHRESVDIVNE